MAGAADQSKARVFSVSLGGRSGGGATYAPSGYARQYLGDMAKLQFDEAQSKIQRDAERATAEEARLARQERLDAMAQQRLDLEAKRQQDYQDRELARQNRLQEKQDRYDQRMDDLDKITGFIDSIPASHRDAPKILDDLRSSKEFNFHELMAHRDTRQALGEAIKSKVQEHKDIISGIQTEGKKYGLDSIDIQSLPVDENGRIDFATTYKKILPEMGASFAAQKKAAAEQEAQQKQAQGFELVSMRDAATGEVTQQWKKKDPLLEMQQAQKRNAFIQQQAKALKEEIKERYKISEGIESPSRLLDEKGQKVTDPSKAVVAVWLDPKTKKEIARMPEEERAAYVNQFNVLNQERKKIGSLFTTQKPAPRNQQEQESAQLDATTAALILEEAGGDAEKARDIAKQRGYIF